MDLALTVLLSVLSSSIVGVLAGVWTSRRISLWEAKREACLQALEVATAVMANVDFVDRVSGQPLGSPMRQPKVDIAQIRHVDDLLTVYCKRPETIAAYRRALALGDGDWSAGVLDELRNAVRSECGVGRRPLARNPNESFIFTIQQAIES